MVNKQMISMMFSGLLFALGCGDISTENRSYSKRAVKPAPEEMAGEEYKEYIKNPLVQNRS